jgi:hypothetical protein
MPDRLPAPTGTRGWTCALTLMLALSPPVSWAQAAARPGDAPKPQCSVAEFRTIGRAVHHPDARHRAGMGWLRINLPHCNLEQARLLGANRTQWYGTADDAELAGVIDRAIEALVAERPELLRSLFSPAAPEASSAAPGPVSLAARGIRAPDASQQAYQQYNQQANPQQQYQQPYPQQQYPQQAYPQAPAAPQ